MTRASRERPLVRFDQAVHEAGQREREHHEAGDVRSASALHPGLGDSGQRDDDRDDADRQVDEEDPSPGQTGGERAAEQRPDRDGETGDGTPDAERDASVLAAERVREQRQRDREHDRAADALQPAGELQHRASTSRRRTAATRS